MSYAAAALQAAVYSALVADEPLSDLVGSAIYDAEPGAPPPLYVALGPERVVDASDATASGAVHTVVVSVVTEGQGFAPAKAAAARISEVLDGSILPLTRGRVVNAAFQRARARRDRRDDLRRIDLTFRYRTDQ